MTTEIVPAIDIIGGKCVRLSQGDYSTKKEYNASAVDVARQLEDNGCRRLHIVDLDGAISHHIVNYRVLEAVATKTSLTIDFGGGIKSDDDARIAFESGAKMITGGSIAVKNPLLFRHWLDIYGSEKIILGADTNKGKIATNGWTQDSKEEVIPFIEHYMAMGVKKVISTDIESDGMLKGPSVNLYREIIGKCPGIYLIASGGVRSISDIEALAELGLPEVIVGKAIYEGYITSNDIYNYNKQKR